MQSSDKHRNPCCTAKRDTKKPAEEKRRNPDDTSRSSSNGMIKITGGTFLMGTDTDDGFPADGEGPVREVKVESFFMDKTAVTNSEFAEFVKETGYKTEAEKFGWSFVFHKFLPRKMLEKNPPSPQDTPWWRGIKKASWRYPEGPGSNITERMDHPVTHISWNDAVAYCKWAGKRLPTEAEWEYAARGGLKQNRYPWGNELLPNGEHRCNIWQGDFPEKNTEEDGYSGTAPVTSYKPNSYGLYNMAGNVWEWCEDWFSANYPLLQIKDNPTGPGGGDAKVIRGGSYLCHHSYCNRYRVAARTANTPDSSTGNLGFRCVKDA